MKLRIDFPGLFIPILNLNEVKIFIQSSRAQAEDHYKTMSYRRVCFTLNNPQDGDSDRLLALWPGTAKYIIFGRETAPTTGTIHLQGFVSLVNKTRWNAIRELLPRSHLEVARGKFYTCLCAQARALGSATLRSTHVGSENTKHFLIGSNKKCIKYCKKDEHWVEAGALRQGNRPDLDGARETADSSGMRAVVGVFNFQAIRVAEIFLKYNETVRDHDVPVVVHVLWGATGVGKTRKVTEMIGDGDAYWHQGTKWWDGYDAHDIVVLDDFRGSWWPYHTLLRVIDRYPCMVEVKGGNRQLRATTFYITSTMHPRNWYNLPGDSIDQLLRRVTTISEEFGPVPEVGVPEVAGNNRPPLERQDARIWPSLFGYPTGDSVERPIWPALLTTPELEDSMIL